MLVIILGIGIAISLMLYACLVMAKEADDLTDWEDKDDE